MTTTSHQPAGEYAFAGTGALDEQMNALQSMLDPHTMFALPRNLQGRRCWEIGAGGGSVAAHLARETGPGGHVWATDLDTGPMAAAVAGCANLTALTHDVRTQGVPAPNLNLIHARLVLLHLPDRQAIVQRLWDALAPGGTLIIEDFDCHTPLTVHTEPEPGFAELFDRVISAVLHTLHTAGADLGWAGQLHHTLTGLPGARVESYYQSATCTGDTAGHRLHLINSTQFDTELRARGLTGPELELYRRLIVNPATTTQWWRMHHVTATKAA